MSLSPRLETISRDLGVAAISSALERDGACIVEQAISPELLDGMNTDLDRLIAKTGPGLRNPAHERFVEFYGDKTIRLDGIPAKSETFVKFMLDPLMHEVCAHFLLPSCYDYLLNTAQLIQIGPGESEQELHRDEDAWPHLSVPRPQLEVEAMLALTDFTVENGATRVVPGSHNWEPDREPQPSEILQAEMKAGSALYYLGSTMHGGGANLTQSVRRRGMFYGYVVGWLRTEENMFLTVPFENVKNMPDRVQELLGYQAHGGIGVVDIGTPKALFND
ncbi:MAG: mitomycin antibiotic biosynthesis protein [Pseudomonadales bacterium]|nr:mitomycin antibiotic biosynthesis protein [Pseudomonadales bacterium]